MVAAVDDTLTAVAAAAQRPAPARRHGPARPDRRLGGRDHRAHVAYALDDAGVRGPRVRFVGEPGVDAHPGRPGRGGGAARARRGAAVRRSRRRGHHGARRFSDALVARARAVGVRTEYHRIPGGATASRPPGFFTRRVTGGPDAVRAAAGLREPRRALERRRGRPVGLRRRPAARRAGAHHGQPRAVADTRGLQPGSSAAAGRGDRAGEPAGRLAAAGLRGRRALRARAGLRGRARAARRLAGRHAGQPPDAPGARRDGAVHLR